jgi:hypothetical protein
LSPWIPYHCWDCFLICFNRHWNQRSCSWCDIDSLNSYGREGKKKKSLYQHVDIHGIALCIKSLMKGCAFNMFPRDLVPISKKLLLLAVATRGNLETFFLIRFDCNYRWGNLKHSLSTAGLGEVWSHPVTACFQMTCFVSKIPHLCKKTLWIYAREWAGMSWKVTDFVW